MIADVHEIIQWPERERISLDDFMGVGGRVPPFVHKMHPMILRDGGNWF
jgi:hypothetical protein